MQISTIESLRINKDRLANLCIYTGSDVIRLSAMKVSTVKDIHSKGYRPPFRLKQAWYYENEHVKVSMDNDNPIVNSYMTKRREEFDIRGIEFTGTKHLFISKESYDNLSKLRQERYMACLQREIILPDNNGKMISSGNMIKMLLNCDVSHSRSIYAMALNNLCYLHDCEITGYKEDFSTTKNQREALRHHLVRAWRVNSYEHNIFFSGEIGFKIMRDLQQSYPGDYQTSVYLEKGLHAGTKILFYNVTAKEEGRSFNKRTDLFKLETQFQNDKVIRDVRKYRKHPVVQDMYCNELKRVLNLFYSKLQKGTKMQIKRELQARNESDVYEKVLSHDRTLTVIQKDIKQIDKKIIKLTTDMNDVKQRLSKAGL